VEKKGPSVEKKRGDLGESTGVNVPGVYGAGSAGANLRGGLGWKGGLREKRPCGAAWEAAGGCVARGTEMAFEVQKKKKKNKKRKNEKIRKREENQGKEKGEERREGKSEMREKSIIKGGVKKDGKGRE